MSNFIKNKNTIVNMNNVFCIKAEEEKIIFYGNSERTHTVTMKSVESAKKCLKAIFLNQIKSDFENFQDDQPLSDS